MPVTPAAAVHRRVLAEVVSTRPEGTRHRLTLSIRQPHDGPAAQVGPGQFVLLPAAAPAGRVLPSLAWLAGASADPLHGVSWEVIWDGRSSHQLGTAPAAATAWVGPLGRRFRLPADPVTALVVGDGAGQGVARWLTTVLAGRGCRVAMVLSGRDPDDHLDLSLSRRVADQVWVTDSDEAELAGALQQAARRVSPDVVYGIAAAGISRVVAGAAEQIGAVAQVTGFSPDQAGCGSGLCRGCELRVSVRGSHRSVLPCVDGPPLPGPVLTGAR